MNYLKLLIDFFIFFVGTFLIYYFAVIRKSKKFNGLVPVEVNLILLRHPLDLKKINYYKFMWILSLTTSFNMALSLSICFNIFSNIFLVILISFVGLIPLTYFSYNIIGNYFEKNNKKN